MCPNSFCFRNAFKLFEICNPVILVDLPTIILFSFKILNLPLARKQLRCQKKARLTRRTL